MPKFQIINRNTMQVIVEQDIEVKDGKLAFQGIVPDIPMSDVVMLLDGRVMRVRSRKTIKREVVGADQIIETYWTFGKNYTSLSNSKKSKFRYDLNLHVEVNEGNNGKELKLILETDDKQKIPLRGVIFKNEVVFDKVFEKENKN